MFTVCVLLVCANIFLGGGTSPGFLSDVVLQLVSVPALIAVLFQWHRLPLGNANLRRAVAIGAAIVCVPLVQLVPLPSALVSHIEPNSYVAEALRQSGVSLPIRQLSVAPYATALSALSLLPPATLFLAVQMLTSEQRQNLNLVFLGTCFISCLLGFLQLAGGPASPLRPYAVTNIDDAVGFFANRNHFAALIYCALIYLLAWAPREPMASKSRNKRSSKNKSEIVALFGHKLPHPVVAAAVALGVFVLIVAEATSRSRAGILLSVGGLGLAGLSFVSLPTAFRADRTSRRLLVGTIVLAALFVFEFAAYRMVDRFTADPRADGRLPIARNAIAAAQDFFPLGSGMGSFTTVYPRYPKPREEMIDAYANRAHDDVLELFVEAGLMYVAVTAAVLLWLGGRARAVWGKSKEPPAGLLGTNLAKASIIVVGLLMLHAFVDYALRTAAMAAVFAYACSMAIPAPELKGGSSRRHRSRRSHGLPPPADRQVEAGVSWIAGA